METKCSGNCMACEPFQRQYCAAQMTYNNMGMINTLVTQVKTLSETLKNINVKIETMQNAEVFNPMEKESQEGDGEKE